MDIYLETHGCSANQSDSEMMLGLLEEKGHKIVDSPEKSDINILNTCIVKSPTENRMRSRIKGLEDTGRPLIIAGCMTKTGRKSIERLVPRSSLIDPDSIHAICEVVEKTLVGQKMVAIGNTRRPKVCLPKVRRNSVIDIVQISSGCVGDCYYCQTKFAKGKLFSYPSDLIVRQIRESLGQGVKEIWLTSQDTGCYGMDTGENLPMLLEKTVSIPGRFFVRVGMMNPDHIKTILQDILEVYKSDKIFKFIHIPVQSGSDKVLKAMNRHYTSDDFREIVQAFRERFPMVTLATDVIVGYPGETKKDFEQTMGLIRETEPDIVNVSKFWPRPKTEASRMKQVGRKTINGRTREVVKLVKEIRIEKNRRWLGWAGEVLINEKGRQGMVARNLAYKPIATPGILGDFAYVKITDTYETYLRGN